MKHVFIAVFVCLMFSVSSLFAQSDPTSANDSSSNFSIHINEATVSGGISLPYLPEETRHYLKKGWNTGVGIGMSFEPGSMGYGSIDFTLEYTRFAFDNIAFRNTLSQANIFVSRNPTTAMTFMLNFKGSFSSTKRSIAPYFLLGVGGAVFSGGAIVVGGDTSFTIEGRSSAAFAWTAGVGVEIPITESVTVFFQGKSLLIVMDETRQYFPLSAGICLRRP